MLAFFNRLKYRKDPDSLPELFFILVARCRNRMPGAQQREMAVSILEVLDNVGEDPATYKFLVVRKKSEDPFNDILRAVEGCDDDLAVIVLCRILQGYCTKTTSNVRIKRMRKLTALDATKSLIQALRDLLKDKRPSEEKLIAIDAVAFTLMLLAPKDRKFTLKTRLGGLLPSLAAQLCSQEPKRLSLMTLLARCARSPRNAQLLGKHLNFPERLVECLGGDESSVSKTARFTEILYFLSKNRKNKSKLLESGILSVLIKLFNKHFDVRLQDGNLELCLITVACLRQLAKYKSGKDQLVKTGALELCEQAIKKLAEDKQHGASLPPEILADVERLQHSLCTLCMRCLPVRQFPLGKHPFPLTFPLPTTQSPTKLTSGKSEDVESSDEDNEDEDDDIIVFGEDGELVRSDEEDTEQQDEGASNENGALSQLDRRKLNELDASYRKFFKELLEGAMIVKQPIAKMQSPKVGVANHKARKSRSRTRKHSDSLARKLPETKTVGRFVKIAYPELVDPGIELPLQPMVRFPDALQETVVHELARARQGLDFSSKVVFDLDKLISEADPHEMPTPLKNNDRARIGKIDASINHLLFESRFECGNLRRATQVGPAHYELILSPDVNQNRPHFQWFYFEVSNNEASVPYTFEIINCLKTHSMFSTGMQPVMFSTSEAAQARPGWVRAGHSVCYYRNLYTEHQLGKKKSAGETRSYFSVRFTITFRHKADVCYLAYHYPYTYTYLQAKLECLLANPGPNVHVRSEKLCDSLAGNAVPILTITAAGSREEVSQREIVFLSGRVHPGESNASWMMQGCISFLLSNAQKAIDLRERFIFKLVPMLNPDGVINGSHRCSLVGQDLNRQWDNPSSVLHPTVYHTKGLLQWLVDVQKKRPLVTVDFHGHSRRSNVFFFGNNPEESWRIVDHAIEHEAEFMVLPELLDQAAPGFSLANCRFGISKGKEPSNRVVLWRQFGIARSYTMESTYCGFDSGPYQGYQVGIRELQEMGRCLCETLLVLKRCVDSASILIVPDSEESSSDSALD